MTPQEIAELRRLRAEGTPGPWAVGDIERTAIVQGHPSGRVILRLDGPFHEEVDAALALIVAAVNALPALLDRIEALEGALDRADGWLLRHDCERDHACAECVPNGPIVEPGFQCAWHEASSRALAADPLRPAGCRFGGGNRGWCVEHDAEWRIDRDVCESVLACAGSEYPHDSLTDKADCPDCAALLSPEPLPEPGEAVK